MVIYIFSGTKALYDTLIKYEINDLSNSFKVVVFLEFESNELIQKKNIIFVPIYRSVFNKRIIKFVRILYYSYKLKNIYSQTFANHRPSILICHSDENFESILAIYLAKSIYKSYIIRRTPSVVINPQLDFFLQKSTFINYIERLIVRFVNNYILLFIFTHKIHKSRLFWFPNNHLNYNSSLIPTHFDLSLCYSESCKFWLGEIGENSSVISLPDYYLTSFKCNDASIYNVLIVPSNDYLSISKILGLDKFSAAIYVIKKMDSIINILNDTKYNISIKFRSEDEMNFYRKFSSHSHDKNIKILSVNIDIYTVISNYSVVLGFNTTVLWKQSLYKSYQKLISYQLIDHDFYNIYNSNHKINFINLNSPLETTIQRILLNDKDIYETKIFPSMKHIVENLQNYG